MDKGIRQGVNAKFAAMLPQLKEIGGKKFRREILDWTVAQYGVTMASASTHYNFAAHSTRKATPELVEGLGRAPEKNNGGRKKGSSKAVTPSQLLANVMKARGVVPGVAVVTTTTEAAADKQALEEAAATLYTVKRKDGTIVAENVSQEAADALVAAAKKAKKGTLIIA